jgi:fructoselysine transporter
MFISIIAIAILYLAMNVSVTSVIPWQEIKHWVDTDTKVFVISTFIERLYGHIAANIITIMILWVALASLFAVMLGYSRVPFAAAQDGAFFKIFAKLHPTKSFPYISLLVLAAFAFVFSLLFKMKDVISGILAMRIMVQFIGQAVGLMLLRERKGITNLPFKMKDVISGILAMRIMVQFIGQAVGLMLLRERKGITNLPFKMPLYPLPVILAILMWLFVFSATGVAIIATFGVVLVSGIIVYMIKANINKEWPFENK